MGVSDRIAGKIYRIATTRNKLKIIMTPVSIIIGLGILVFLVVASLWLDRLIPLALLLPKPINIILSTPLLITGAIVVLWPVYRFFRTKGTPVPLNPPPELVTSGIYARVRNPMILGWTVLLVGLGLWLNSVSLVFIASPLFVLINAWYLRNIEEKELEKKFGKPYLKYRETVPMFIPGFGKRKG